MLKTVLGTLTLTLLVNVAAVTVAVAESLPKIEYPQVEYKDLNSSQLYVLAQEKLSELQYDEAAELLKEALKRNDDKEIEKLIKLSLFITYKVGGNNSVKGVPNQGIARLNEAIKMRPDDAFLHSRRGDAYCELGRIQECLNNHSRAIEISNNKGESYSRRAFVYWTFENHPAAYSDYKKSIEEYRKSGNLEAAQRTQSLLDTIMSLNKGK